MKKPLTNKQRLNVIKAYAKVSPNGHVTVYDDCDVPVGVCGEDGSFRAFARNDDRRLFAQYMAVKNRMYRADRWQFFYLRGY